MEKEIISRLLETNEKAITQANKRFNIVAFLLLLSLLGNVYLASLKKDIIVEQENISSDFNNNYQKE